MKFKILTILLSIALIDNFVDAFQHQMTLNRLIRAANDKKGHHQSDCRYDKEAWEECDSNGQQRRVLKLKTSRSAATNCESEKFITRPCKKNCRYSKGVWTDCVNGSKHRTDNLKPVSTAGCEPTRNITKACKEQCNYVKSEWSSCESGFKTKTLTLQSEPGVRSACEPTKLIRKPCGNRQNRKDRPKNKKIVPNITPDEE
ncbi:uncharacterized protein LOC128958408 [Oppia nitens]|uniref:uncharacterized protein LOC128958408 n=1 Tax=Oppia nitens TaxID=1686743 RepID=UPI0023DB4B31|nr:uncharacterized protein LOC128958408 [Oppia nitens]